MNYLCDKNDNRLKELSMDSRLDSLELIHPEELAGLKNTVVILMLGDPRSALEYLGEIVGIENCITYNNLILDELMTVNRPDDYYENSWDRLLQAFGCRRMKSLGGHCERRDSSEKIIVGKVCSGKREYYRLHRNYRVGGIMHK